MDEKFEEWNYRDNVAIVSFSQNLANDQEKDSVLQDLLMLEFCQKSHSHKHNSLRVTINDSLVSVRVQ